MENRKSECNNEIYPYSLAKSIAESSRCLNCFNPPCVNGCPSKVPIPQFIQAIKNKDFLGAAQLISDNNVFGWCCGLVCPTEILCQSKCTRKQIDSAVDIGGLQRFAFEQSFDQLKQLKKSNDHNNIKVAIIGAGPAGLSAGAELKKNGFSVTVFNENKSFGGTMIDGIPPFRLPKNVVKKEVNRIIETGVDIKVKKIENIDSLFNDGFKAILITTGLSKENKPAIGNDKTTKNIYTALDFLKDPSNCKLGKKPIIIGGGNTAIDAARTVRRIVGDDCRITILYRRSELEMPAWEAELNALRGGKIEIRPFCQPVEVISNKDSEVQAVKCQVMDLGEQDTSKRRKPVPIQGSEFIIEASSIIWAAGQYIDEDMIKKYGLEISNNTLKADENGRTNKKNIYAAGDITGGQYLVVKSVAQGKEAARSIIKDLLNSSQIVSSDCKIQKDTRLKINYFGFELENPFLLAAAPPTDELDMLRRGLEKGWAGAILKTTSVEGTSVDLKYPMMAHLRSGEEKLWSLGNIDLISQYHIDEIEKRVEILKKEFPHKFIIASIMGAKKEDWQTLVQRLESAGVDAIECSFSCPQGTLGSRPGAMLGQDIALTKQVTGWVKEAAKRVPVFIKITPQVTDIVEVAKAVKQGGADGICAANSIPGLVGFDLDKFEAMPSVNGKTSYSGITGPSIKPLTLRTIAEIARNVDLTITGTGGPSNWYDVIEFILVGATTVQFCTAVMHDGFDIINGLIRGVINYLDKNNINHIMELKGKGIERVITHDKLSQTGKIRAIIDESTCIKCGRCHRACFDGGHEAIEWIEKERKPSVNKDKCVGCGFCSSVCPSLSIRYNQL